MHRQLNFRWPQLDISVRVNLLDELNPDLANILWAAVPLHSIQTHAAVAGKQIYFPTRLLLADPMQAFTELMSEQSLGRINFEPFFQYISINYGPVSEAVPAWPLAQVIKEDLGLLPTLGKLVWQNLITRESPLLVVVDRPDGESQTVQEDLLATAPNRTIMLSSVTAWRDVLAYLRSETDTIWLNEPEDVRALRSGILASDAGVYDQYLSPWIMVTGLVRSLAVVELASLVRLCGNTTFSVEQLKVLLHEMLSLSLGVIGFFGLPILAAGLQAVDHVVDQIEVREHFAECITALITYVNRYNLWLHQTFPWHLSLLFPKPDVQALLKLSSSPLFQKS